MQNVNDFIQEYNLWAEQDKYKDFQIIKPISQKWQKRLHQRFSFNLGALIFGPFYLMFLGAIWSGMFGMITEIFLYCLLYGLSQNIIAVVLGILVFHTILGLNVNRVYINKKRAFKKKMQDFDPTATVEWFNISTLRLFLATILSGGCYLIYWFYRQSKAIKMSQKDNTFTPVADGVFYVLFSHHVFKRIDYVCKKEKSSKAVWYGVLLFFMPGLVIRLGTFFAGILLVLTANNIVPYLMNYFADIKIAIIFLACLYVIPILCLGYGIEALIVNNYRRKIASYCKETEIAMQKKFTGWEIFWIVIGIASWFKILFN